MYELMRSVCDGISTFILIVTGALLFFHFLKTLLGLLYSEVPKTGHVLVTGCDTGFGHGIAMELSRRKCFVFAGCLSQEGEMRLQSDPTFNGTAFIMDITKTADIENAKQIIEQRVNGKGLWAVVNNAGIAEVGLIEWQTVERMQHVMNINLWGAVSVTKAMLPLLKEARGRVINITSIVGRVAVRNAVSYSMSKFAFEAFSDGLRYEMKPWELSVHIIEPGFFHTNITDVARHQQDWRDLWEDQPEGIKHSYGEEYFNWLVSAQTKVNLFASRRTDKVVNSVCHAVTSSSPKLRYVVGFDANTIWMAMAMLPTCIGDCLMHVLAMEPTPAARKICRKNTH